MKNIARNLLITLAGKVPDYIYRRVIFRQGAMP